jgi:hypothetical protein
VVVPYITDFTSPKAEPFFPPLRNEENEGSMLLNVLMVYFRSPHPQDKIITPLFRAELLQTDRSRGFSPEVFVLSRLKPLLFASDFFSALKGGVRITSRRRPEP